MVIRSVLLGWICALSAGCSALIPAHPLSYQLRNEEVSISFRHLKGDHPGEELTTRCAAQESQEKSHEKFAPLAIAAVAAPYVAEFAIKKVAASLKDEAARYVADYSGLGADDKFYACESAWASLNLDGMSIERTVDDKPAFKLDLAVQRSLDATAFRLIPLTAELSLAKAKVADVRSYLPWTWSTFRTHRGKIDIDVDLTIEALWTDANKEIHNTAIASLTLPLRKLPLGGRWAPNVPGSLGTGWFQAIPRSPLWRDNKTNEQLYGLGTYVVKVKVREYDDYGKQVTRVADYVESNREAWVKQVRTSVETTKAPTPAVVTTPKTNPTR
jgi:hypothetical protein